MRASDPTPDFLRFRATGDPGALARVFDAVAPRLLLLALHLTRNRADAEDAVQETFVAAIDAAPEFDPRRDVRAWLSGILARRARELRRRRARRPDPARLGAAAERTPLDVAADVDAVGRVDRAIDALPQAMREVLVLRLHHGLTGREIARALGRSVDTVHTQMRRGLEALRQRLPAGLAAVLVRLEEPGRGLGSVREVVLERVATPVAAAAPLVLGGVLVKKLLLACVAALAVAVMFAQPWRDAEAPAVGPVVGGEPASRARSAEDRAPVARPEPVREPVAGESPATPGAAPAFEIAGRCVEDRTGAPIPGCTIRVAFADFGRAAAADRKLTTVRATTDADGRFCVPLETRPASRVSIEARMEGFVARTTLVSIPSDTAIADAGALRLVRGWQPTGIVVLRDGRPAPADLDVNLRGDDLDRSPGGFETFRPDQMGRFACRSVFPPGRLRPGTQDGWHVVSIEPADYDGRGPEPSLRIIVERIEGSLSGVVVDRQGIPVEGGFVAVRSVDGTRRGESIGEALTDEHGRFEVLAEVPYSGPVRVEARDHGVLRPVVTDPRTFQWGDRDLRIEIDRLGRCVVEVVDGVDGVPVPIVDFCMGGTRRGSHMPDGRFELALASGTHEILVRSGQGLTASTTWVRVDMPADDGKTLRVVLPRVAERSLRVVSADGAKVTGSEIQVVRGTDGQEGLDARLCKPGSSRSPLPSQADGIPLMSATTDADGTARIGVPQPADDIWLLVRGAHVPRVFRVADADPDLPIQIVVDRGRVLQGQVTPRDALQRLGGDVTIQMEHTDDPKLRREVALGADGRFEIANVVAGRWSVVLIQGLRTMHGSLGRHRKLREAVTISPDTDAVRLDVGETIEEGAVAALELRVLRDGLPLRDARLQLVALREDQGRDETSGMQFGPAHSDDSGVVRFDRILPGRYRLAEFEPAGRRWSDETLEVSPAARVSATVNIRSRTLRAQLVDADDAPVPPGQLVKLHSNVDARAPEARTDGSGTVVFPGLGPGPWRVTLVTRDGDRALGEVTFGDGDRELERRYTVR